MVSTFTQIREGLLDHARRSETTSAGFWVLSAVRVRRWRCVPVLRDQSSKPGNHFLSMLYGINLVHATPPRSAAIHELVASIDIKFDMSVRFALFPLSAVLENEVEGG